MLTNTSIFDHPVFSDPPSTYLSICLTACWTWLEPNFGFLGDVSGVRISYLQSSNPPPLHLPPLDKLVERSSVSKACPAHPDVLLQPQVLDLVHHPRVLPVKGRLRLVGLDRPNITGHALHQLAHQARSLGLDLRPGCGRSFLCSSVNLCIWW